MIRRNARMRREYLYRKSLEGKEKEVYEKKRKIKEALASGRPVPRELHEESMKLNAYVSADDANTERLKAAMDDEYNLAGEFDPKVVITTARSPSSRLIQFAKELRLVFPNSQQINRGNTQVKELFDACRKNQFTDVIVLHEHRGIPDGFIVSHLPYGPTAFFGLTDVVLRHDLTEKAQTVSEAFPHLIFHNLESKLGKRCTNILKYLFPVPKPDSKRVMSFINRSDIISFRHHTYATTYGNAEEGSGGGKKNVELMEVGPRFELKPYQIKLGTLEMREAQDEWVLRPYMNTANKRNLL
eukprot:gb/GEZN01010285.1/.p1 GENE.gb/GEZN01010285.1/~~gb/GEZN01010285.1/.p1  ORF type:complete len:299 (-),score=34.97 gb/GEZN01010285.1/:330-1226(-)